MLVEKTLCEQRLPQLQRQTGGVGDVHWRRAVGGTILVAGPLEHRWAQSRLRPLLGTLTLIAMERPV